mmetsp:Transcript_26845/g.62204  ORF Transcript_26845/g.62204 Transcript_26845/m.62204 type:complete len:206 (+) Transcript_26845:183-800(+)
MAGLCKGKPSARRGRGTRRTKDFCAVPRGGVGTAAHSWVRVLIAAAQLGGLYKTQRAKQSESTKRGSGGEPPRARRTEGPTTPAPRSTGPKCRVGGQGLDEGRLRGGGAGSGQRRHSHAIAQGALAGASARVCAIAQARACGPHRASATNQDVEGQARSSLRRPMPIDGAGKLGWLHACRALDRDGQRRLSCRRSPMRRLAECAG